MSDDSKKYFSLHGAESEGWRLMMYTFVGESVTPAWSAPKEFPKLQDALAELCEHEVISE